MIPEAEDVLRGEPGDEVRAEVTGLQLGVAYAACLVAKGSAGTRSGLPVSFTAPDGAPPGGAVYGEAGTVSAPAVSAPATAPPGGGGIVATGLPGAFPVVVVTTNPSGAPSIKGAAKPKPKVKPRKRGQVRKRVGVSAEWG